MKRFLDVLLVLATMPAWLALQLLTALAVAVSDGFPVLFRQERAGKGGRPFGFLKFRTMREGGGTDADRTTRLGRFLRRTSLDELPQLWHVLSGRMSLVGPRPLPAAYLPRYNAIQARRHEVRPGITGWAQINGLRGDTPIKTRIEYDIDYIENWTPLFDLRILLATVFRGKFKNDEQVK